MENSFLKDYTVVDIETTGLSPQTNEIIELSAIKVREGKAVENFTTLVKPQGYINSYITNLTGITNEMVKNAPSIESVLSAFCEFIADDCIMGHNVNFDLRFIKYNVQKHLSKDLLNESVDTVKVARKFCPKLQSYKLANLANHFDIDAQGHHRALKDCEMTLNLYNKIIESLKISK